MSCREGLRSGTCIPQEVPVLKGDSEEVEAIGYFVKGLRVMLVMLVKDNTDTVNPVPHDLARSTRC